MTRIHIANMNIDEWKSKSDGERKDILSAYDTYKDEGYDLARAVAEEYKKYCRWPYEKYNIVNRYGELMITVYLEFNDYQVAERYPIVDYYGFKIMYGSERNYIDY